MVEVYFSPERILLGLLLSAFFYIKIKDQYLKILVASFIAALFFSVSIIISRIAVLAPTTDVIYAELHDWYRNWNTPAIENDGDSAIFIPFLVQWALLAGMLALPLKIRRKPNKSSQPTR